MSSAIVDPASSWQTTNNIQGNASGVTFSVKFMGYVPLEALVYNSSKNAKEDIVRLCISTVVSSQLSGQFNDFLAKSIVGSFMSFNKLDMFLNIANFTTSLFLFENGRTHLLGRYLNANISHYEKCVINGCAYLGLIMSNEANGNTECNVLKLESEEVIDEVIRKIDFSKSIKRPSCSQLICRLRSTQEFHYKPEMLACYHGSPTEEQINRRLLRPGDFLLRDSNQFPNKLTASYKTAQGIVEHFRLETAKKVFYVMKQFQIQQDVLLNVVVRS